MGKDKPKPSFYPLRISKKKGASNTIFLLLIGDEETQHYILVTDLSRLLCNGRKNKKHYCLNCLRGYVLGCNMLMIKQLAICDFSYFRDFSQEMHAVKFFYFLLPINRLRLARHKINTLFQV